MRCGLRSSRRRGQPVSKIPRTLHYCFGMAADFGGKPWGLSHHACVASAIEHICPDRVNFYCEYEPEGPWWDLTRPLVDVVKIKAPRSIFGNAVEHPAHRADVVRLQALIREGGIYLDTDVLVHRAFDPLLGHDTVLGAEGVGAQFGTANAVVLARPNAPFLERWMERYRTFRGTASSNWNEHSVRLPYLLSRKYPDEITIVDYRAFFWPLWTPSHLEWIFNSTRPCVFPQTYATHLWDGKSYRYTRGLTPRDVRSHDTNFHRWVIPYLAGLPDNYGAPHPAISWNSRLPSLFERSSGLLVTFARGVRARLALRDKALPDEPQDDGVSIGKAS